MIYCLIGPSACGKSTIERKLEYGYELPRIVSMTTREKRPGEENGKDYHFLTESEFSAVKQSGKLVEHAVYRQWNYGLSLNDIKYKEKDYIVVVTPHGYEQLLKELGERYVKSIFINVSERTRLVRLVERGDDIDEIIRRIHADREMFNSFSEKADYMIKNSVNIDKTVGHLAFLINSFNGKKIG